MDSDIRTDACPSPPRHEDDIPEEVIEETPQINYPKFKTTAGKNSTKKMKTRQDKGIYINKSRDIHIGSTTTFVVNLGSEVKQQNNGNDIKEDIEMTTTIKKLLDLEEPVLRSHLIFISEHIRASTFKSVARHLNFSDGQIDQFYEDFHKKGMREVIYKILLDWIQYEANKATLGKLAKSLWNCDEKVAVNILAEHIFTT